MSCRINVEGTYLAQELEMIAPHAGHICNITGKLRIWIHRYIGSKPSLVKSSIHHEYFYCRNGDILGTWEQFKMPSLLLIVFVLQLFIHLANTLGAAAINNLVRSSKYLNAAI